MKTKQKAFTLIELSMVLVIIGLLVGGVLVGQDLIRAAGVRATIGQMESYSTAANTFKLKYGQLPGDIPPGEALSLGFFTFTGALAGQTNYGNGNGLVEGNDCVHEPLIFWRHLSEARMIDGFYGNDPTNPIITTTGLPTTTTSSVTLFLPTAKLGTGNYFVADSYTWPGLGLSNHFSIVGFNSITNTGSCTRLYTTPAIDAYNIDAKLDNGIPYTGRVYSQGPGGGGDQCVASGQYLRTTTPACNTYFLKRF